jgi:AAA+ ATPase superfamily predicted ATPase
MFKYDVLIEGPDICNYEQEIQLLKQYVKVGEKAVLCAPRRFGKTSILINVLGKHFARSNKDAIFLYVNLQEVKEIHSISIRFSHAIEEVVKKTFAKKSLLSKALQILKSLRPKIEIDPLTGSPSVTITLADGREQGSPAAT